MNLIGGMVLLAAIVYVALQVRKLKTEVAALRAKVDGGNNPPIVDNDELRNVGQVEVERHERRYHLRDKP